MFHKTIKICHPAASERNSESCGTTTQLSSSLGENCSMSAKKRKARKPSESPRKRQTSASGPAQSASEAVPAKSGKRKASTERGTLGKKQKCGPSCTNSNEAIGGNNWKEQDRAEKLPASQAPMATNRERTPDPSPGPSGFIEKLLRASLRFTRNEACFEEKYSERGILGQGGFSLVYAGTRKTDNLPVAIKRISKRAVKCYEANLDEKTIKVPLEAFLMVKVGAGPASVAILDWYEVHQEVILVMERPDPCLNMLDYMLYRRGPLEEDVTKNIMKQLVDAALTMHTKGVFHRDIKAENLLLETDSDDPRVRVIDFGCGCLVQKEPYSSFSGTKAYTPPEFFTYGRYEAVPTTVWQLGALLYEMLKGPQTFSTSKFLCGRLNFNTGTSQDCQNFMRQCLASDPQQRATLKQLQLHPWLQNQDLVTPQTPAEMPGL